MQRTPEQIRTMGLAALKRELGIAGMIRFLQQFDRGSGDWTTERTAWANRTTMNEIRRAASKKLSHKRRTPHR